MNDKNSYQETISTYNKVAKLYEEKFMHLDIYNESYDHFLSRIAQTQADIFEVGCGPGNISFYMLHHRPSWKWRGIDAADKMVALANANNPTAHFEVGDARALRLESHSTDALVAGFCIPYFSFEECEAFFQNTFQGLRSKGLFYFSYVPGSPEQSGFLTGSSGDRVFFYYHEKQSIMNQLSDVGFQVLETFQVSYQSKEIHEVVIAQKAE